MRKAAYFLALTIAFALPPFASAYTYPGDATGLVNDFAQILSVEDVRQLESRLRSFEASTTNEIAVVTIPSLEGDTVENYAVQLFKEWGIGKADTDNGVLLLVAKEDRAVRIEVGYGLEGAVPDATSNRIIQKEILPYFRDGDYGAGIAAGVDALIRASQNEYTSSASGSDISALTGENFEFILVVGLAILSWLASILGRSKSWWLGGVLGGAGGAGLWAFGGLSTFAGAGILALLITLGLLFDYYVSTSYRSHVAGGTHVPWWAGGGGFGGGRGGGGFGGFGGGSSGGGGASGRW